MTASVRIIIVNWNTGDYLARCLGSIAAADREGIAVEKVVVIDNASTDRSADGVQGNGLPLEVVRNPTNVGFARACNQGADGSRADYLLFLNPDTTLYPNVLSSVASFMNGEEGASFGICGVQMVDGVGAPAISCARFPTLSVMVGKMTGLSRVLPETFPSHHLSVRETRSSRPVDQVIGAFFFVRRDLFVALGGFDERYFLYFEDVDFALRARRRGSPSYFLSTAKVFHAGNVSSNKAPTMRLYHSLRSRLLFAFRHWPRRKAWTLVVLTLTIEVASRLLRSAVRLRGAEVGATLAAYAKLLPELAAIGSRAAGPAAGDG